MDSNINIEPWINETEYEEITGKLIPTNFYELEFEAELIINSNTFQRVIGSYNNFINALPNGSFDEIRFKQATAWQVSYLEQNGGINQIINKAGVSGSIKLGSFSMSDSTEGGSEKSELYANLMCEKSRQLLLPTGFLTTNLGDFQ